MSIGYRSDVDDGRKIIFNLSHHYMLRAYTQTGTRIQENINVIKIYENPLCFTGCCIKVRLFSVAESYF